MEFLFEDQAQIVLKEGWFLIGSLLQQYRNWFFFFLSLSIKHWRVQLQWIFIPNGDLFLYKSDIKILMQTLPFRDHCWILSCILFCFLDTWCAFR